MQLLKVLPVVFVISFFNSATSQSAPAPVACPAVRTSSGWLDLFPLPCRKHAECRVMGTQHLCCKGYCTKGVKKVDASAALRAESGSVVTSSSSSSTTTATSTTTSTTPSTTSSTTTTKKSTTTTKKSTTTTKRPTEAPRSFLQILPIQTTQSTQQQKNAPLKTSKNQKLVCPKAGTAPVILFPIPCENNAQCRASSGPGQVCCDRRCTKGAPAPRPTSKPRTHQPILGVIPRECPAAPLGELLFEVQPCASDAECWPRLCCPDGTRSYCRTARARLDLVPGANQIDGPVRMFEQYLQCTPPPQYDLFPQRCNSSVDCFPNLCCAEGGAKHCRPPQRSLLTLLSGIGQRVGSTLGNLRQARQSNRNNA